MSNYYRQLGAELRQAGADTSEVGQLTSLAAKLSLIKAAPATQHRWSRLLIPAGLALSVLVIGVSLVMLSQSAAPTSWLYGVQKLSDAAAIKAHPEFRAVVMMRRAQQVNQLVASRAPSQVILSTLSSYQTEAADYKKMSSVNYAAFDYCKTNLEQATAKAPADIHQAIQNSLNSLSST